ncbi:T-cell-specific guanine nucleotide triphosphate-binding protein 2-like isoform X2 [Pristis pectinata]|uniref:T-cell-specific guanine nucleotide triphosphate-binding protein 2-like isoform X2 n=2 Tax=Pristis pectinata TaxID=685728 RepID=UPI00223D9FB1|nr:T-cell-specific guanine nucleotide triphosphate-binding protein 2-like isoform X2 [Pristis pectinata]
MNTMAPSVLSNYFSNGKVGSLQSMHNKGDVVSVILDIKQRAEDLADVQVNIAVLGDVGSGKSTFINAMRGLRSDDPGAAPSGNDEPSTVPTKYRYPSLPNVHLWDLPGLNSFGFELNRYLKQVQFESYDFYIIVSQSRFRESDGELSKKIQEQQKGFYYIRSKIDNDAYSMQMQGIGFNEGQMQIHRDCVKNFRSVGVKPPAIFLISGLDVEEYDLPKLKSTLASDLQSIKSNVFSVRVKKMMREIQVTSGYMRMLMLKVWLWSLISGALGALREPGLPLLTVIGCTVAGWIHVRRQVSISDQELRRLSNRVGRPLRLLQNAMQHRSSAIVKTLLGAFVVGCTIAGFTDRFSPVLLSGCGLMSSSVFTFRVLKGLVDYRLQSEQNLASSTVQRDSGDLL